MWLGLDRFISLRVKCLHKCALGLYSICCCLNGVFHFEHCAALTSVKADYQCKLRSVSKESCLLGLKDLNIWLIPTSFPQPPFAQWIEWRFKEPLQKATWRLPWENKWDSPDTPSPSVCLQTLTFWPELMPTFSLTFVFRQTETLKSPCHANCRPLLSEAHCACFVMNNKRLALWNTQCNYYYTSLSSDLCKLQRLCYVYVKYTLCPIAEWVIFRTTIYNCIVYMYHITCI